MFKNALIQTKIGQFSTFHRSGNPTLVFLSGIGNFPTKENFTAVIGKLPAEMGILTIDFPNVGESSMTNQAPNPFEDWVDAIAFILESYQVREYILVAHSISGFLALKLFEKVPNCHGFIGIEPSTVSIMTGQIHYPEFDLVNEKIAKIGFESYFQAISESGMTSAQHQALWAGFDRSTAKWDSISNERFAFYPNLEEADLLSMPKIPENIPSILFSQAFRKDEYAQSEYVNIHPQSQLVLLGDSHYLHWTESEAIAKSIESLIENRSL